MTDLVNKRLPAIQILTIPSKTPLKLAEILQTCVETHGVKAKHNEDLVYVFTPSLTLALCKPDLIATYLGILMPPANLTVLSCHLKSEASLFELQSTLSKTKSIKVTDLVTEHVGLKIRFTAVIQDELAIEYVWSQNSNTL